MSGFSGAMDCWASVKMPNFDGICRLLFAFEVPTSGLASFNLCRKMNYRLRYGHVGTNTNSTLPYLEEQDFLRPFQFGPNGKLL